MVDDDVVVGNDNDNACRPLLFILSNSSPHRTTTTTTTTTHHRCLKNPRAVTSSLPPFSIISEIDISTIDQRVGTRWRNI